MRNRTYRCAPDHQGVAWLIFALFLFSGASAEAAWWWPFGYDGTEYKIVIRGVDAYTQTWFDHLKLNQKTDDHPPKNLLELGQEGATLENRIRKALAARGYYDAILSYRLDKSAVPPTLLYSITPNRRYHLSDITVDWNGSVLKPLDTSKFPVHPGDGVDAQAINDYAGKLSTEIGKDACLLSLDVTPVLNIDGASAKAKLTYRIKNGPRAHFGPVTITGNDKVSKKAIERSVAWKDNDCYTEGALTKTRSSLIGTQLFSTVTVTPPKTVDADGRASVTIAVKERVERTVTAGVNYATDQGYGLKLGWEHRNVGGDGEKLDINSVLAQQQQSLTGTENIPGFMRNDQTLVLTSGIDHQHTEAYSARDINLGASVDRKIDTHLDTGLGLAYLLSHTDDTIVGAQSFGLISTPAFAQYDTRDNAQDARKGIYARLAVTPYVDTFDLNTDFAKALLTGQTYLSSEIMGRPTLALRASLGTIAGASATSLPSDLRFYAGGGGSVRGYSYQTLSPTYLSTPIGGASLTELSAELRLRFSESFGGVLFLDGGNSYASGVPRLGENLYYGAGVGVRYFSPLGPLRLDVGFPLNGRNIDNSGVDAKGIALYVSLGQAF